MSDNFTSDGQQNQLAAQPPRRLRFTIRHLLLAFVLIACASWCVKSMLDVRASTMNTYNAMGLGDLLANYAKANDGRLPSGWDELEDFAATAGQRRFNFASLRRNFRVRFDGNLVDSDHPRPIEYVGSPAQAPAPSIDANTFALQYELDE